jgi:tRNA (guanine37-N1)-methyltransferase
MNFHVVTLFPDAFTSYLGESIVKRAIEDKKIRVSFYNPRDFTKDKHARVDRKPYGGGPGMVLQAEPVARAIEAALKKSKKKPHIIFFSPQGKQFDTAVAKKQSKYTDLIMVCGRYEGIDARVKKIFKMEEMEEISVGPYVLTGGELPAMIMIDSVARQVEGVLGDFNSLEESRVASNAVYTRPDVFKYKRKTYKVPKILLSGDHKKIENWKKNH